MAEQPTGPIRIRRIAPPNRPIGNARSTPSLSGRTIRITPPGGGSFTPNELSNIIPPQNARAFKIVRVMGGRYNRPDNPQGVGTEGPFTMDQWPGEDSDFSAFEDMEITRVIFDVGP